MTDPTKEAYEGVMIDVYMASRFRTAANPNEPAEVNAGIAFTMGMYLALHHPEYARALEPHFDGPDFLEVMTNAAVQGNPIDRVEVEEPI